MINVTIVGKGNVSFHLAKVFKTIEKVQVTVRDSRDKLSEKDIRSADVCIIAVSDTAIKDVSEKLKAIDSILVHTSGSVPMNELPNGCRRGVFYPLQTFSKEKEIDFAEIPICIEAENRDDLYLLFELAGSISGDVREISSSQRKLLHMAAIFANNFTNHLYHVAFEICKENNLPFDLIKPLILETADKIKALSPFDAQTGPARRNDLPVIQNQLESMQDPTRKKIYEQLTQSIRKTYGQKL